MKRRKAALPGGFVVFADDIRQEVNGKLTLVGTYANDLSASGEAPYVLPQLWAMIVFRDDPEALPRDVTIKVLRLDSEEEVLWQADVPLPAPTPDLFPPQPNDDPQSQQFIEIRLFARFAPFTFSGNCRLSVRAYLDNEEVRLGSLLIHIKDADGDENPSEEGAS